MAPVAASSNAGARGSSRLSVVSGASVGKRSNLVRRGRAMVKCSPGNEEEDDGLHGGRMKPLSSLCTNSGARKPLGAIVRCGSGGAPVPRLKRAAESDFDKENLVPSKRRSTSKDGPGNLDVLLQALDSCPEDENDVDEKSALKPCSRLRSSLRKRRTEDDEAKDLKEKFTDCITSTDIQELPLLDRAEAKIEQEVEVVVHELNEGDDDGDVSLRLCVGGDASCSLEKSTEEAKPLCNRDGKKIIAPVPRFDAGEEEAEDDHRLAGASTQVENLKEASNSRSEIEALFRTPIFATTAVNVAARWLDLLQLDLKGRLAALKRSRRNVRGVILSGQFGRKSSLKSNVKKDPETEKWLTLFLNMDSSLAAEGAKLEVSLRQVQEMQNYCDLSPPHVDRVSHCPQQEQQQQQQPAAGARNWLAESSALNRTMALAASAASICSTAALILNNG